MDIVELIKREHAKINGLFDKLADTSDGAVKTRERLFDQLKTGLEVHGKVVQEHIYPLLRKDDKTRELVPELKERNEIKRQLADLDRTAKNEEGFLPLLKEFRKTVEQQLRTEERQIFPAIKKAIGSEDADELAKRIAAETREGLDEAKQQEKADEGAEMAMTRTTEVVSLGAQRALEEAGETAQAMTDAAADGSRRLVESAAGGAERIGRNALRAAEAYAEDGWRVTESARALQAVPTATIGAMQEVQRAWMDWFGQAMQTSTRASQELFRCASLPQLVEVQRGFLAESLKGWMEGSARVLQAAQRASQEALRPAGEHADRSRREDERHREHGRR